MHFSGDPPAIRCYSTTFLSFTCRLLSSLDDLAREVYANSSPLARFLSHSGHASSQPKLTEWTKERLRSLLDQARRIRVRRNVLTEDFLYYRNHPHYTKNDFDRWEEYQENRERKHYWGQALCCHYDWDWDLSKSLKRLFRRSNTDGAPIRSSKAQGDEWLMKTSNSHVPGVLTVEYRTATGEIRLKIFRSDPLLEDVTVRNHAPDDSTQLPSTSKEPVAGSSSSEGRLEYKNILKYREINRHVRRKIEAWLNDGWTVEWEWNWVYDKWRLDERTLLNVADYWTIHQMTLRRSNERLPPFPSPSTKRIVLEFPKTPKP